MKTEDAVKVLMDAFVIRKDAFSKQIGREYYKQISTLNEEKVTEHLEGKVTLGTYNLNRESKVKWCCFDLDGKDLEAELEKAKKLFIHLKEQGFNPILEFSGMKGYHVWVFFEETLALTVKVWGEQISKGFEVHEIFPKQGFLEADGYGNLVKIPLGVHQVSKKRSYFLNENFERLKPIESIRLLENRKENHLEPGVTVRAQTPKQGYQKPGKAVPFSVREKVLVGAEIGDRHKETWKLAMKLYKRGFSKEEVLKQAIEFNENSQEPKDKKIIARHIETLFRNPEKYLKKKFKQTDADAITLLAIGKRREATENLVTEILEENKIYTTRDDEKAECWIYNKGIYVPQGKTFIKEYCRQELGQAYTIALGNEVIAKIEVDTYINQEEFFKTKLIDEIAIENGILDLKTKQLAEFTPEKIFFNKLPVEYDPEAVCPAIKQHFKEVLPNEDDTPIIEELCGYLLYKDHFIEKAVMLTGDGRNGKGKTIELFKRFIGAENCKNISLQQLETDPYAVGELFNKMANISGDLDSKALKHTGNLKMLTGRDMISASRKYLTRVNFVNFAKMIFACNKLPKTNDLTIAFWNRWVLLEFPYKFFSQKELDMLTPEERKNCKLADTKIIEKITTPEELSGLLNLAIEGLHRLLEQNDFSYNKSAEDVKTLWIRKSDSFSAFLMDCIEEEWESTITKAELRKEYAMFCKENKLAMVNDKAMKNTLTETLAVSDARENLDGKQVWIWEGIKFKEQKSKGSKASKGIPISPSVSNSYTSRKTVTSPTTLTEHLGGVE